MQRSPYNVQLWTIFKEENDPQQSFKISLVENTYLVQLLLTLHRQNSLQKFGCNSSAFVNLCLNKHFILEWPEKQM